MMCRDEWFGKYIVCYECLFCRKEVIQDEEKAHCCNLSQVSGVPEANPSSHIPPKIFWEGKEQQPYMFTL